MTDYLDENLFEDQIGSLKFKIIYAMDATF